MPLHIERLLLVSGSTRRASTNTAALLAAPRLGLPFEIVVHDALTELPHFDPDADQDPLPAPVAALREQIGRADAVVFCTPEYAGTLPGSFKNLLDWTVGGAEMDRRPAAWINVAPEGRGGGAEATLRIVLGYVNATILPSAGTRVYVPRAAIDERGEIADAAVLERLAQAYRTIAADAGAIVSDA